MPIRFIESKSGTTGMKEVPGAISVRHDTDDGLFKWYDGLNNTVRKAVAQGVTPSGVDGTVMWAEVALTNAEMLALRATPKTLVAAPGAGYMLEFVAAQLFFDYTAAYTETADNMAIRYTDGSGSIVSQAIEATGFVDATADTMTNALPKIDNIIAKSAGENKALVLHNTGDGEYGGGNAANVVRVKIAYRRWSTGF